jgi:hypothetical protein
LVKVIDLLDCGYVDDSNLFRHGCGLAWNLNEDIAADVGLELVLADVVWGLPKMTVVRLQASLPRESILSRQILNAIKRRPALRSEVTR